MIPDVFNTLLDVISTGRDPKGVSLVCVIFMIHSSYLPLVLLMGVLSQVNLASIFYVTLSLTEVVQSVYKKLNLFLPTKNWLFWALV